jgi:hypothetical protein
MRTGWGEVVPLKKSSKNLLIKMQKNTTSGTTCQKPQVPEVSNMHGIGSYIIFLHFTVFIQILFGTVRLKKTNS